MQLLNYSKATDCEVGFLLNFGKNQNSEEKYLKTIANQEKISNNQFLAEQIH
ncbi:MAG: GxxExxY protein [Flavobacterium sp.]